MGKQKKAAPTLEEAGTIEQQNWTETDLQWIDALEQIDYDKDKKPICDLLESDIEMSPQVRKYLKDLIERRVSVRAVSDKRLPAYHHGISPLNWHYLMTHREIDAMREADPTLSLDDAIEQQATKQGLKRKVLRKSYHGRHTSFRKARKKLVDQP